MKGNSMYSVFAKQGNQYLGTYIGNQGIAYLPNMRGVAITDIYIEKDEDGSNALRCYLMWKHCHKVEQALEGVDPKKFDKDYYPCDWSWDINRFPLVKQG